LQEILPGLGRTQERQVAPAGTRRLEGVVDVGQFLAQGGLPPPARGRARGRCAPGPSRGGSEASSGPAPAARRRTGPPARASARGPPAAPRSLSGRRRSRRLPGSRPCVNSDSLESDPNVKSVRGGRGAAPPLEICPNR